MKADYFLHYYGPYSYDVAWLTDRLTQAGLLGEKVPRGQYRYTATARGVEEVTKFEQTPEGQAALEQIEPYIPLFQDMVEADLRRLELGSTILLFYKKHQDWDQAVQETAAYKRVRNHKTLQAARELAERLAAFPISDSA